MPGPTTESLATDFRDSSREFAQFRENVAGFQGRVETELRLIRWVGVFFATVLMAQLGNLIWLAWEASAVKQQFVFLEQATSKSVERLDRIDERLDKLEQATTRNGERLDKLEQVMTRIADRLDRPTPLDKPKSPSP